MKNKYQTLFESAFAKVMNNLNENEQTHSIDPRGMLDSIGWEATEGLLDTPYSFEDFDDEAFDGWMESQGVEVVPFKKGATEVMNYAKDFRATPEELNDLKAKLIEFGKTHKGKTFFLYGIETDVSLGVI